MEFKVLDKSYRGKVEDLWDYCFEKKDDPFFQYYFGEYAFKQNTIIGGVEDTPAGEKLRIMLHLNPYTLKLRGKREQVPYIVGVATAPEARGNHLFRPLLKNTMEYLRDQGINFVTLMPINAGIYLPYEFAFCYYRHAYDMPLKALQKAVKNEEIARIHVERTALDVKILSKIYNDVTLGYHAVAIRKAKDWKKLIKVYQQENVQCAVVYDDTANPCAYMLYSISDGVFHIHEMMTDEVKYKNRLLQYAAQHESSATEFKWLADRDDLTYLDFSDATMSGSVHPFMMARCVNVRGALKNLEKKSSILKVYPIVLRFTDNMIEENNCTLKLYYDDSRLVIEDTDEEPYYTMNMAAFTQLYFGAFNVETLYVNNRLELHNGEMAADTRDFIKIMYMDTALGLERNYNNEYF